jgi:group I intron endonuclease
MYYLVYKTTNLINGKVYIGSHIAETLEDDYLGSGILLRKAIKKYGNENFKREIIHECETKEHMLDLEFEEIERHYGDNCYNVAKMAPLFSHPPKDGVKQGSSSHRNMMAARHYTDEQRAAMSERTKGNQNRRGKPFSEEARQKLRDRWVERKIRGWKPPPVEVTPELVARMVAMRKMAGPMTEETHEKITQAIRKRLSDPAERQKISKGMKRYRAEQRKKREAENGYA